MEVQAVMPIILDVLSGAAPVFRVGSPADHAQSQTETVPQRSPQDTYQAFAELLEALQPFEISLRFMKDDETGTIVVQLIDGHGETLQQIPSEARLHIAATLCKLQGGILDLTV